MLIPSMISCLPASALRSVIVVVRRLNLGWMSITRCWVVAE